MTDSGALGQPRTPILNCFFFFSLCPLVEESLQKFFFCFPLRIEKFIKFLLDQFVLWLLLLTERENCCKHLKPQAQQIRNKATFCLSFLSMPSRFGTKQCLGLFPFHLWWYVSQFRWSFPLFHPTWPHSNPVSPEWYQIGSGANPTSAVILAKWPWTSNFSSFLPQFPHL